VAGEEFAFGDNADHGGIVSAEGGVGQAQLETIPIAGAREFLAQGPVAGDTSRCRDTSDALLLYNV
jgi:hypothetical protein